MHKLEEILKMQQHIQKNGKISDSNGTYRRRNKSTN